MRYVSRLAPMLFLAASPLHAAVLTVGPDGEYSDLQAALDLAVANDEDDNIRIQTGTLVTLDASAEHSEFRYLEITGGWVSDFTSAGVNPTATLLSGTGVQPVLRLTVSRGEVVIRNLGIVDGAGPQGAGADISVEGNGRFQLRDCEFRGNTVVGSAHAQGGGLRLSMFDSAAVEITDCRFEGNSVSASQADGGGLYIHAHDGELDARRVQLVGNMAAGATSARGGGAYIDLGAVDAVVELRQLQVRDNLVDAAPGNGGAGLHLSGDGVSQTALIEGAEFSGNSRQGGNASTAQMQLELDTGTVRLRSLALIDGAATSGLHVLANNSAQVVATNITASGNDGDGIRFEVDSLATQGLQNTLSWNNGGADLDISDNGGGGFQQTFNIIGTDPGVVNAAAGDYRLAAGSAQINVGWPNPIAGLGVQDARGGPRVQNLQVDRGAYEFFPERVFGNGFETE